MIIVLFLVLLCFLVQVVATHKSSEKWSSWKFQKVSKRILKRSPLSKETRQYNLTLLNTKLEDVFMNSPMRITKNCTNYSQNILWGEERILPECTDKITKRLCRQFFLKVYITQTWKSFYYISHKWNFMQYKANKVCFSFTIILIL